MDVWKTPAKGKNASTFSLSKEVIIRQASTYPLQNSGTEPEHNCDTLSAHTVNMNVKVHHCMCTSYRKILTRVFLYLPHTQKQAHDKLYSLYSGTVPEFCVGYLDDWLSLCCWKMKCLHSYLLLVFFNHWSNLLVSFPFQRVTSLMFWSQLGMVLSLHQWSMGLETPFFALAVILLMALIWEAVFPILNSYFDVCVWEMNFFKIE